MVKVKLYGLARIKFNVKELDIEAKSIKELLKLMSKQFNVKYQDMKNFLIFVNDINITELKMFNTSLNNNDIVMMLSPSSGG